MIKHWKFGIRVLVFVTILVLLISEINYILMPKKYFDDNWPTTSTYKGFYQMKADSIDVLFLGSSHAAAAFNPQVIYDNYGIGSYNLGCEEQNLLVSYYWLKEALKYQSPKVVVLDTFMVFNHKGYEALNTPEACTRMAMDAMKWSEVKWNAIKDICDNDENQLFNSYLFKNIRFHTRWTYLQENDFSFRELEKHYELKGYAPLSMRGTDVDTDYLPYEQVDTETYMEMMPLMKEYLDKIVDLCKTDNITLVLTKCPTTLWNISKHNTVNEYAREKEIYFWDFNEKELYDASGFVFGQDMNDNGHSNIWGAEKLSLYVGDTFSRSFEVKGCDCSEQWSETAGYYQQVFSDCKLQYIVDLPEYIDAINQPRYTVLIGSKYDITYCMNEEAKSAFAKLGLDLSTEQFEGYYAAISGYGIIEGKGRGKLLYSGSVRNNMVDFTISSEQTGVMTGNSCSIKINNIEYAKDLNGVNIVVYSNETRKVVDSVVYDGQLHR